MSGDEALKESSASKQPKRKSRKIEVEWNDEKVKSLISAVEAEPVLWDASLKDYKNKLIRDSTWQSISECMFAKEIEASDLNTKWQNLRCQFKDHLNKFRKKKSGQGTDENYVIRWKHYEQMKFLLSGDGNEVMETTSNISSMVSNLFIFCQVIM